MLRDPEWFERIADLIVDGAYGFGSYLIVRRDVLGNGRDLSAISILSQMVGGLECSITGSACRREWKRLTGNEQAAVNGAVLQSIVNGRLARDGAL